ncbi:outer membrane protein [Qipengyuania flava]|uniref:outer membrane protein n=1 Tax=Qipengyuania flava TaxID=192812 RepID=UPI001C6291C8|nr:outer membrane beta-barrel protein [Qipengyuania flava]QYJ06334.1 porin family protein [Qipengyuania flava]
MRKIALFAAVATVAVAAPASANEARVEARGGIAWANGVEEAVAGVAAGYDFDLGTGAFIGVEASADKILADGTDVVFGATARGGAKLGDAGKLYVTAGYSFNDGDAFHAGAGYEHKVGERVYLKAEYRRFFDFVDVNTAVVGVGMSF